MRILLLFLFVMAGFAQVPSTPRRTAEFTVRMSGHWFGFQLSPGYQIPVPFYLVSQGVRAVRSDGAMVAVDFDRRTVWLPQEKRVVTIDLHRNSTETQFWRGNPPELFRWPSDATCRAAARDLPGIVRFDGWREFLGVRVASYRSQVEDSRYLAYFAPELNCYPLKSITEEMIWYGIPLRVSIYEAADIRLGVPDPALFRTSTIR